MISDRKRAGGSALIGSAAALAAAAAAAALMVAAAAEDPAEALAAFFLAPLSSAWFLGNTLDAAALLATAAVGVVVAFRAGTFNLGGEGQIYAGGLAASAVLLFYGGSSGAAALAFAALAGAAAGAALGAVSGSLKARFGVDEMISSFLAAGAIAPIADYLISGPLRDGSSSLLATARFAEDRLLPRLMEPSALNWSALIAPLLALAAALALGRTAAGYRLKIAGSNPAFARFAGIESAAYWTPAMAVSGAFHGLSGFFAVAGTYGLCHRGFSGGMGWSALAVALIARNEALALLPAAFLYAWLETGSETAMLGSELSIETVAFVQAIVFLLVTARFSGWKLGNALRFFGRRG